MADVRINSFNEGSLLKRTLVHVVTMVLGSLAFVGVLSLVLVTLAKGALPKRGEAAESEPSAAAELTDDATPAATAGAAKTTKGSRPPRRKGMAASAPEPSEAR
jgi:hypothetical protein